MNEGIRGNVRKGRNHLNQYVALVLPMISLILMNESAFHSTNLKKNRFLAFVFGEQISIGNSDVHGIQTDQDSISPSIPV